MIKGNRSYTLILFDYKIIFCHIIFSFINRIKYFHIFTMNRIKVFFFLFTYKIVSSTQNPYNIFHTVMFIWFFFQMEIFILPCHRKCFFFFWYVVNIRHSFIFLFGHSMIYSQIKKNGKFLRKYSLWRIEGVCSECINIFMKLLWYYMEMPFIFWCFLGFYVIRLYFFYDMCKRKNEMYYPYKLIKK